MSTVAVHDAAPDPVVDSFERALAQLCTDPRIRAIEAGDDAAAAALWREVDELGFTDALVALEHGGAGLTLQQACPLLTAAGRFGLNHPFGETMVARALLRAAGWQPDDGCIALARADRDHRSGEGTVLCREVPGARLAGHVLVQQRDTWLLMPCAKADVQPGTYRLHASGTLSWRSPRDAVFRWDRAGAGAGASAGAGSKAGAAIGSGADAAARADVHAGADAETWNNAIHAAAMAGAMERVLALSVAYANDRRQFGRAIGQFQAVQQDLAVLAEQAGSAVLAARIGCASPGPEPGSQPHSQSGSLPDPQPGLQPAMAPDPLLAATAKLRASEAALRVAMLAHAVFGAIGITEEHVLGVFTTRLHEWRATAGTERDCAARIGSALLRSGESFPAFIRAALVPSAHVISN